MVSIRKISTGKSLQMVYMHALEVLYSSTETYGLLVMSHQRGPSSTCWHQEEMTSACRCFSQVLREDPATPIQSQDCPSLLCSKCHKIDLDLLWKLCTFFFFFNWTMEQHVPTKCVLLPGMYIINKKVIEIHLNQLEYTF